MINKKVVESILQFLRNTKVGSGDRTMERDLKRQKKSDKKREIQLAG